MGKGDLIINQPSNFITASFKNYTFTFFSQTQMPLLTEYISSKENRYSCRLKEVTGLDEAGYNTTTSHQTQEVPQVQV